jgi:hypothetical protein
MDGNWALTYMIIVFHSCYSVHQNVICYSCMRVIVRNSCPEKYYNTALSWDRIEKNAGSDNMVPPKLRGSEEERL